jgi:hypothetical protein
MQADWRPGLVAPDKYAQPITGLLRITGTSLNGSILFAGKFS